jgi:hypothetical protein
VNNAKPESPLCFCNNRELIASFPPPVATDTAPVFLQKCPATNHSPQSLALPGADQNWFQKSEMLQTLFLRALVFQQFTERINCLKMIFETRLVKT